MDKMERQTALLDKLYSHMTNETKAGNYENAEIIVRIIRHLEFLEMQSRLNKDSTLKGEDLAKNLAEAEKLIDMQDDKLDKLECWIRDKHGCVMCESYEDGDCDISSCKDLNMWICAYSRI